MYRQPFVPNYRYSPYRGGDQRFFPFFGLPFLAGGLAGLAISPFLFNRPWYGPGPYYPPYPPAYPPYGPSPYPGYSTPYGANYQNPPYNVTENINVYPQR